MLLFSPCTISAAFICASIYALGLLLTYWLASLFQVFFRPRSVIAVCIYASIHVLGVLFT
jgi:hypothetical protein